MSQKDVATQLTARDYPWSQDSFQVVKLGAAISTDFTFVNFSS